MRSRKILIVGDGEGQIEILQQVLEDQGHQVFSAGSPQDAVEACSSVRPHLVILDLVLPGPELLTLTKQLMMSSVDPPTVLVTGSLPGSLQSVLDPGVSSGFFTLECFPRAAKSVVKPASKLPSDYLH